MTKALSCIMLIDDNAEDNFIHKRVINKTGKVKKIVVMESGEEALQYLANHKNEEEITPELILLDINMPRMTGWEFLEEYEKLSDEQKAKIIVVMLSTSPNDDEKKRALDIDSIKMFCTKPLTIEKLNGLFENYFPYLIES